MSTNRVLNTNTIKRFLGNEKLLYFIHSSCYYSDQSNLYSVKNVTDTKTFANSELISFDDLPNNNQPAIDGKIILYNTDELNSDTERNIIQGINSFYLIVTDSDGVRIYEEYKDRLSSVNSIISNVIGYRRPDQSPNIQIVLRNTLLYIKTYISSYLTQLKMGLKPIISADDVLDSVFINHNTKLMIPSSSSSSSTNKHLQYFEYIDYYINGNQCGNQSLTRVYLPYDISKDQYENEFIKKRLNGTLVPFQNNNTRSFTQVNLTKILLFQLKYRLRIFQSLYDCYYMEYLYNHQYYDISKDEMIFNLYNYPSTLDKVTLTGDSKFQLDETIFNNDTIVNALNNYLDTNQTTLIRMMKDTYRGLAKPTTDILNKFMTETYDKYNGYKYSCAKLYANIKLIKFIKDQFVATDFSDSSMVYLHDKIPNDKIIKFALKINQFPDISSRRNIKNVLTNDKLIHLMNSVNPNQRTNVVPNNYYNDLFQKNDFSITFQWIEGTIYKCIIFLKRYNDENVIVPFPINIPIQYRQNQISNSIKFVKLPIEIYYSPSTFSLFKKYNISLVMDLYFKQTHSVPLCDEYPYTRLGLMQYANEDIHYLTKMLLSNGEDKYTLENFIIFRCFQDDNHIETLWGRLNQKYSRTNDNINFDLYPYLNYIIHVDDENYIKEPRIFIKRRVISLLLYILRKIYPIIYSVLYTKFSKTDLENFVFLIRDSQYYYNVRNTNNYERLKSINTRVDFQKNMNNLLADILHHLPPNLDKTDWNNIFNGRLLYIIYTYNKSLKQDDKLDFNEGELLTEDIIRQRVIQWTTGLVYLPEIPPTHEQIGHLLLEKIINKDSSTAVKMRMSENVIDIWVKVLLFNREIYMKLYYGDPATVDGTTQVGTKSLDNWIKDYTSNINFSNTQEISLQNTHFLGSLYPDNNNANESRIIQWTSPLYDYNDEILNIFYSTMSCLIYVGLNCYFRCYFYIDPPLPIPDNRILGWCWSLPFIIESSAMRTIYNAVLERAKDIALDILRMRMWNNYTDQINRQNQNNLRVEDFSQNLTVLENTLTGEINTIISSTDTKEKIYAIASTLQKLLGDNNIIDQEKDIFVDIDVNNNYENEYRVVPRRQCEIDLQLGTTSTLVMSPSDREIYENNIKTRFTKLKDANQNRNKEFIKRIICIARETLETSKYVVKAEVPSFDLKKSGNILPYYQVINNNNTYIDEGISDKEEIEFIGDYMFNESVNKEDSIIVNDSKVCIELSKIVNDTDLTSSEISAFPKNSMDDYTKIDSIRQMIESEK